MIGYFRTADFLGPIYNVVKETTVISPTIGRMVWFWPVGNMAQPYSAQVVYVHDDRKINIAYYDHNGHAACAQEVLLIQEGDERPISGFCEWMPYQVKQAAAQNTQPLASPQPPVGSGMQPGQTVDDKLKSLGV